MFFLLRHTARFFIRILLFTGLVYAVINSVPVQKILYPVLYRDLVFRYAAQYQVEPYLVFSVIKKESRFLCDAESRSGARGLMQVMPETAAWSANELRIDYHEDMLFEPEYNIRIGCWYLGQLHDIFPENMALVLASYNAGQGNVRQWLEAGIWDGDEKNLGQIPFPETRIYVEKVIHYYHHYQHLYDDLSQKQEKKSADHLPYLLEGPLQNLFTRS